MDNITEFVKKTVVLVIVVSALMNLTTGEKYAKYLKFVVGLMIVFYTMTVLSGLINGFDGQKTGDEIAVNGSGTYEKTEESRNEMINKGVLESYASDMEYSLKASGYDVLSVECSYEDDTLAVTFTAESGRNLAGIKKYINDFYHVDGTHIYGYTEAEDE